MSDNEQRNTRQLEIWSNDSYGRIRTRELTPGGDRKLADFRKLEHYIHPFIDFLENKLYAEYKRQDISTKIDQDCWNWKVVFNEFTVDSGEVFAEFIQPQKSFDQIYSKIKRSSSYDAEYGLGVGSTADGEENNGKEDDPVVSGLKKINIDYIYHKRPWRAFIRCLIQEQEGVAWLAFFLKFIMKEDRAETPGYDDKNTELFTVLCRLSIIKLIQFHRFIFGLCMAAYTQPYKAIVFIWLYKWIMPWMRYPLIRDLYFVLEYKITNEGQLIDPNHDEILKILRQLQQDIKVNKLRIKSVPHNSLVINYITYVNIITNFQTFHDL